MSVVYKLIVDRWDNNFIYSVVYMAILIFFFFLIIYYPRYLMKI